MTEPYFSLGMASWREKMMKALYRIFNIPKVSKEKKNGQKKNECLFGPKSYRHGFKTWSLAYEMSLLAKKGACGKPATEENNEKHKNLNETDVLWTLKAGNRFPGVTK